MLPHLDSIFMYCKEEYPLEACGILAEKSGKIDWLPCSNHDENPSKGFRFNSLEYIKILMSYDKIFAIVHSHPDADATPSDHDIASCNAINIPYLIVSWPNAEYRLISPGELNVQTR